MADGIGVRLTGYSSRIIKLSRSGDDLTLTELAAGSADANMTTFAGGGMEVADAVVVFGLGPGDFLSATMPVGETDDPGNVQEQLRWELEQKMVSDPGGYNIDFTVVGGNGFAFAGQRQRIDAMMSPDATVIADVEPVALFNCCEAAGLTGEGTALLLAVESEGITAVVIHDGLPVVMDAVVYRDQEVSTALAGFDRYKIAALERESAERLSGYLRESIERVTSLGDNGGVYTPDRIVLAGTGAYVPLIPESLEEQYGMTPQLVDPFDLTVNDAGDIHPELAGMGTAFTTSFGLALRALEE